MNHARLRNKVEVGPLFSGQSINILYSLFKMIHAPFILRRLVRRSSVKSKKGQFKQKVFWGARSTCQDDTLGLVFVGADALGNVCAFRVICYMMDAFCSQNLIAVSPYPVLQFLLCSPAAFVPPPQFSTFHFCKASIVLA